LAAGIGVAIAVPLIRPVLGRAVRPLAKAVIKDGLLASDAGWEGMARLNEATGDIVGEVRVGMQQARAARPTAAS
jgi:hypothetical protein